MFLQEMDRKTYTYLCTKTLKKTKKKRIVGIIGIILFESCIPDMFGKHTVFIVF